MSTTARLPRPLSAEVGQPVCGRSGDSGFGTYGRLKAADRRSNTMKLSRAIFLLSIAFGPLLLLGQTPPDSVQVDFLRLYVGMSKTEVLREIAKQASFYEIRPQNTSLVGEVVQSRKPEAAATSAGCEGEDASCV